MRLLIFGPGYSASRIAAALSPGGWRIATVARDGFEDGDRIRFEIAHATHILSSVPPGKDDAVLATYGDMLAAASANLSYLSSTGVYGDTGGAWVDESAPYGGRRTARAAADAAWLALGARVFRLPGIYGPGRSPLDRVREGHVQRIDKPGQVFSRIHVDDLVSGAIAGLDAPPGAYNLADDLPAPQHEVTAYTCRLLGIEPPPLVSLDEAQLSPQARAFWSENRRVSNLRAKRLLGWAPLFPDYRAGLRDLSASTMPATASTAPPAASHDQR